MLAREHGPGAVAKLREIMDNPSAPFAAQIMAANSLLDRGYGRPPQSVEMYAADSGPAQTEKISAYERIKSRIDAIADRLHVDLKPPNRDANHRLLGPGQVAGSELRPSCATADHLSSRP
jgi:hypothetical protein